MQWLHNCPYTRLFYPLINLINILNNTFNFPSLIMSILLMLIVDVSTCKIYFFNSFYNYQYLNIHIKLIVFIKNLRMCMICMHIVIIIAETCIYITHSGGTVQASHHFCFFAMIVMRCTIIICSYRGVQDKMTYLTRTPVAHIYEWHLTGAILLCVYVMMVTIYIIICKYLHKKPVGHIGVP